jgi:hypothetical protein
MMVYTQCSDPSADKLYNNPNTRGKIIAELANNPDYTNQLMDSMMHYDHGMKMMAGNHHMIRAIMSAQGTMQGMLSDTVVQSMMIGNMMAMMGKDSAFCSNMGNRIMENPSMTDMMKNKMMQLGDMLECSQEMK